MTPKEKDDYLCGWNDLAYGLNCDNPSKYIQKIEGAIATLPKISHYHIGIKSAILAYRNGARVEQKDRLSIEELNS